MLKLLKIEFSLKNYFIMLYYLFCKKKRRNKRNKLNAKYMQKLVSYIENRYKDYYILLPHFPIGDTLVVLGLIPEFINKYGKKVLILVHNESRKNFINLFQLPVEILNLDISLDNIYYLLSTLPVSLARGKVHPMLTDRTKIDKNIIIKNAIDLYAYLMDVNPQKFYLKKLSKASPQITDQVFLIPYANSFNDKVISKTFWLKLAQELEKQGLKVIFNTKEGDFENYECKLLPFDKVGEFASKCKAVIAFRSGITDLIAQYNINKFITIYSEDMANKNMDLKYWYKLQKQTYYFDNQLSNAQNIFNIWALCKLWKKDDIIEMTTNGDEDKLLKTILEAVFKDD